jgi:methionine-rich copper-binding protein CopC
MNLRRIGAALLLAGLALVGTATPALAHAQLLSSDPAAGAALPTAPKRIQLTFSEPVRLPDSPLSVTGPDGSHWTIGQPTVAGAVITAPVEPVGPAGEYVLDYKVISDDGDVVGSTLKFSLATAVATSLAAVPTTTTPTATTPPTTSATASSAPAQSSGSTGGGVPAWVWVIGAVVLLGVGALVALRMGRSSSPSTPSSSE